MNVISVVVAIAILLVLVMVHEWGHFIGARLTGIAVKQFSVGFGPKLLGWRSKKHETEFMLRLLPLGGYCMFYDEETGKDERAMNHAAKWRRALTIAMGPLMNLALAFVVAVALYSVATLYTVHGGARVVEITPAGAADQAGMQVDDVIESINGVTLDGDFPNVLNAALLESETMDVTVKRGGESLPLRLTARYSQADQRYMMDIRYTNERYDPVRLSVGETIAYAADSCVYYSTAILTTLRDLVFKGQGFENMTGPIGVVSAIAEQTQKQNWTDIVSMIILISINLGLFNLLPVPGLDGSRLIFLLVEAIRRKPISVKIESFIYMAGFVLLIGMIIVFSYRDIVNLLT